MVLELTRRARALKHRYIMRLREDIWINYTKVRNEKGSRLQGCYNGTEWSVWKCRRWRGYEDAGLLWQLLIDDVLGKQKNSFHLKGSMKMYVCYCA